MTKWTRHWLNHCFCDPGAPSHAWGQPSHHHYADLGQRCLEEALTAGGIRPPGLVHMAQESCRPLQFSTECWQASQAWLSFPVLNCCHRCPNFITGMSLDACKNSWKQGVGANLIGCSTGHGCVKRGSKRKEKELPSETAATTETVKIIKCFILSLLLHLKTCSQSQGGPLYLAEMWSVLVKKK